MCIENILGVFVFYHCLLHNYGNILGQKIIYFLFGKTLQSDKLCNLHLKCMSGCVFHIDELFERLLNEILDQLTMSPAQGVRNKGQSKVDHITRIKGEQNQQKPTMAIATNRKLTEN